MPQHPCFVAGTQIATPGGDVPVESIVAGQTVLTVVGRDLVSAMVTWVGERMLSLPENATPRDGAPIRVRRDALAPGVPQRDVLLSHDHRIFVGGKLIPTRLLVNGMTILPECGLNAVHYFHIELEQHAVLLADGMPVESFLDERRDRSFFVNADGIAAMHPVLEPMSSSDVAALACAPLAMTAVDSEAAWQELVNRAHSLGYVTPQWYTTSDPKLAVVADSVTMFPTSAEGQSQVFVLPAGTRSVRLVSRATVPFDIDRSQEDWRRLGVAVARIVLRAGDEQVELPADHPSLLRGWHDAETDGTTVWRWTDGDAHIPLPIAIGNGGATIELHLACHSTYALAKQAAAEARLVA
jgi:hypothetical protein